MKELKYCMVCLSTDVKFSIKDYSFCDVYFDLTQLKVKNLNQDLCFECAGLLRKYQQFKLKCIRTDKILSQNIEKSMLTKFRLQSLQNQFKLASNLVFSDMITEDIVEIQTIGSVHPGFNAISNLAEIVVKESVHTNKNNRLEENDDANDNSTLMLFENNEEKPSLDLKPKMEVFSHNVDADKCTTTNDNEAQYFIEVFTKQDDDNVICEQDSEGIISSNTSAKAKKKIKKKQTIVPKSETIMLSSDDESYHSDTSWTNILNTINKIKSANNELALNNIEESGTANSMSKFEVEYLEENNDNSELNNTKKNVAESATEQSQTTGKQTKRRCKKPPSDKKRSKRRAKLIKQKSTIATQELKKHGTIVFFTQEKARDEVLARAKSNNYLNSSFKCDLCFKGFNSKETLDNHMFLRHNPQKGQYECDYCHSRFRIKRKIARHIQNFHLMKFTCNHDKCSFVGYSMSQGSRHVNIHAGKKYKCQFCKLTFNANNSLTNHIYRVHIKEFESEFICEFCGRVFYNEAGLKIHKSTHYHVGAEPSMHKSDSQLAGFFKNENDPQGPECKECKVHFASEQAWRVHLVLSRKHEVANGCKQCGLTFENAEELKLHWKQHRECGERKRQSHFCQICNYETKYKYYYNVHMHDIHGQPMPEAKTKLNQKQHICEICGAKFPHHCFLKYHRYKHTGERPFKCEYCGKGFPNKSALKTHETCHKITRKFKCHICHKELLRLSSLNKHVRQCLDQKPHKCLECEQTFVNLSVLKAHVRHKHEKVPYPPRKNPRYKRPKKPLKHDVEENPDSSFVN